jgi:hypothetical protein
MLAFLGVLRRPAFAALLAIAAGAAACSATGPTARVTALLGGQAAVAILTDTTGAVKREAWRIDGHAGPRRAAAGASASIHGHPVLAGPVPVDAATAAELAAIVLDDDTYLWDLAKGCEFMPGVAIRATRGATVVDVLLCFSCDEAAFWLDGKRVGVEDTDPRRADLVRIARRLFPDDVKLGALR